jgi:glycerol uptake facilitator-like aquaporin
MEQGLIKNKRLRSYMFMAMYEFFGMILFLVGINCSQNDASVAALGLFIAATLTGRLSGGHFNMAITFAVYVVEGKWA